MSARCAASNFWHVNIFLNVLKVTGRPITTSSGMPARCRPRTRCWCRQACLGIQTVFDASHTSPRNTNNVPFSFGGRVRSVRSDIIRFVCGLGLFGLGLPFSFDTGMGQPIMMRELVIPMAIPGSIPQCFRQVSSGPSGLPCRRAPDGPDGICHAVLGQASF